MLRRLLPVVVVPLVLLAACGKDDDALQVEAGSPAAAVQQAPGAAAKAGSGHVELTMRLTMPGTTAPAEITGTGDFDTKAHLAAMQLDYGAFLEQLKAKAPGLSGAGFDKPMRIVVDDTTMYLDLPFLATITGTAGWLSVPIGDATSSGFGGISVGADPNAMLDYLRGAGKVTEEGDEEIDGVATTKYAATIDLAQALEKVPAAQRERVQRQIDQLGDEHGTIPLTVWIDADGLPRRMTLTMDAPQLGSMAITVSWSKYGEPVSIDVPSADEVTPAKDVLGGMANRFLGQQ